jgi:simple sugar transport system permease protein
VSSETTSPATSAPPADDNRWRDAAREILAGRPAVAVGALILALIAGSVMIAFTNSDVREASGWFFARPGDTLTALGRAMGGAYGQLIRGSIWNWQATSFTAQIRPLMNTFDNATPLIAAGLGVAVTFRAGLFNIGGRGQMLAAAIAAGWVGFGIPGIPFPLHLILCIIAGALAGALWGGIAGFLKAKTGAHEVIATIMLNYVGYYLLQYLLATPGLLQAPGSPNPITPATPESAQLPALFGRQFTVDWGFPLALLAVVFCWWLLNRSSLGFTFRAVGENPRAARVAGIDVARATTIVFMVGGALMGLAGAQQVLGTVTTGFTDGIDGGIGFDAITVALLGGSQPVGVLFAGLLFGAFKAGGSAMQAGQGIPVEIVSVIQSLIVLFIAAPPLVRAIFRLPQPSQLAAARKAGKAARKETDK